MPAPRQHRSLKEQAAPEILQVLLGFLFTADLADFADKVAEGALLLSFKREPRGKLLSSTTQAESGGKKIVAKRWW